MIRSFSCTFLALFAGLLILTTPDLVLAGEPVRPTVVHVDEMCGGCVKKVHRRFDDDEKIGRVNCNVDEKTVTFYPVKEKSFTARYLWVEMDEIGKTPIKLVGPEGTFSSKPGK
tara:strand:+ start:1274 stop:1615 length:342 start_codon:yes stop_codon:yes gene_type:complete